MTEMKIQRCNHLPENEMAIIKDTNTLIHNIINIELEEKDKEINKLKEEYENLSKDYYKLSEDYCKQEKEIKRLEEENFNIRENIHIEKISLPEELTKDKSFMDLYDIPSYEDLRKENKRLKEDMEIKDSIISISFNKDTKEYILDRKNYYKINKRLKERLDYKLRCEKALELIKKEKYIAYDYYENEYITLDEEDILKLENILDNGDKSE